MVAASPSSAVTLGYEIPIWETLKGGAVTTALKGSVFIFTSYNGMYGVGYLEGLSTTAQTAYTMHMSTDTTSISAGVICPNTTAFYSGHTDPWPSIGFSTTDSTGKATFTFSVQDGAIDITGKVFTVMQTGVVDPQFCGTTIAGAAFDTLSATVTAVNSSGVTGTIGVYTIDGSSTDNAAMFVGSLAGLEASVTATACSSATPDEACGIMVYNSGGTQDCTNADGSVFSNALQLDTATSYYADVGYSSTSSSGSATVVTLAVRTFPIANDPLVVYNAAGTGVVGCGTLGAVAKCNDVDLASACARTGEADSATFANWIAFSRQAGNLCQGANCKIGANDANGATAFGDTLTIAADGSVSSDQSASDYATCCSRNCSLLDLSAVPSVVDNSCYECVGFSPGDCRGASCVDGFAPYRSYGECSAATCYFGAVDEAALSCSCNSDYDGGGSWTLAVNDGEQYPNCVIESWMVRMWNFVKSMDENEQCILAGGCFLAALSLLIYICDFRRDPTYMKEKRKRQRLARKSKLAKAEDDDKGELPLKKLVIMFIVLGIVMACFLFISPKGSEETQPGESST